MVARAKSHGAQHIIQLGDMGVWPGLGGVKYLDELNYSLLQNNICFTFNDGNHDDHDQLAKLVDMQPKNDHGHTYIRSNILYSPRGNIWKMAGKKMMTVGGAVSIDRARRTEGKSWWPQEQLTDAQTDGIIARATQRRADGKPEIDYLFTHDASDKTPWGFRLIPEVVSESHRFKMDRILDAVQPVQHFHGHYHRFYHWQRPVAGNYDKFIETWGLDCDGTVQSWGILDTETDTFKTALGFRSGLGE